MQVHPFGRSTRTAALSNVVILLAACGAGVETSAQAVRDYISIVGSSTVYPFAIVVAEQFGRATHFKTPKVESTGTGGGFRFFCAGVGVEHPDITNASRRITRSEVEQCAGNGVTDIVEVKIGYDGIVIANAKSSPHLDLTLREVYLALAKNVPDPSGAQKLVPNPYQRWSDIEPTLPSVRIEVLGPPPTSGTRDAFVELAMMPGCHSFEWVAALDDDAACATMREDGGFIPAGENDNLIVQKLEANPTQLGIFGYSFLEQNADKVQGANINGEAPTFDEIAAGRYPVSRPLYFYVKSAHVGTIQGIREYLQEFTSDAAWGDFGYLSDRGLIPLPAEERAQVAHQVASLEKLNLPADAR
jgi:phosphate transport system substrate-binding protein